MKMKNVFLMAILFVGGMAIANDNSIADNAGDEKEVPAQGAPKNLSWALGLFRDHPLVNKVKAVVKEVSKRCVKNARLRFR